MNDYTRDLGAFLLSLLACPACETHPAVRQKDGFLICDRCGRAYPIVDGIPLLLIENATGSREPAEIE